MFHSDVNWELEQKSSALENSNPLNYFFSPQRIGKSKAEKNANNFHHKLSRTHHQSCCIINQHNMVTTELQRNP